MNQADIEQLKKLFMNTANNINGLASMNIRIKLDKEDEIVVSYSTNNNSPKKVEEEKKPEKPIKKKILKDKK